MFLNKTEKDRQTKTRKKAVRKLESIKETGADFQGLGLIKTDTHVYFAGDHSPLSNLFPCKIFSDGGSFASSEHMFQYLKCKALDKHQVARKILLQPSPRDAMSTGKVVRTTREWCETVGSDIMRKVITAKFEQVPEFSKQVTCNTDKIFVEAPHLEMWNAIRIYRRT